MKSVVMFSVAACAVLGALILKLRKRSSTGQPTPDIRGYDSDSDTYSDDSGDSDGD